MPAFHCAKTIVDRYNIVNHGFNTRSVSFSSSFDDAYGYGAFGVRVEDIDALKLFVMDCNVDLDQDFSKYDGIKYRYAEYRPWNYEIFNVRKLNQLSRTACYNDQILEVSSTGLHRINQRAVEQYVIPFWRSVFYIDYSLFDPDCPRDCVVLSYVDCNNRGTIYATPVEQFFRNRDRLRIIIDRKTLLDHAYLLN